MPPKPSNPAIGAFPALAASIMAARRKPSKASIKARFEAEVPKEDYSKSDKDALLMHLYKLAGL